MKSKYVPLEKVLHEEQGYVLDGIRKFGIEVYGVFHDVPTTTCFEKARILGWKPERVVKSIYLHKGGDFYGFIFPELGKEKSLILDSREVLPKILGITKSQSKKFGSHFFPYGMEKGTCTPFAYKNHLPKRIFLHNFPGIDEEFVDISVGGFGESFHKMSAHIKYGDLYRLLRHTLGDRIEKLDFGFEKV